MRADRLPDQAFAVALLTESVDRNIRAAEMQPGGNRSLSSRRAWIEISAVLEDAAGSAVALLTESVDRNLTLIA